LLAGRESKFAPSIPGLTTHLALYSGATVNSSEVLALSADPRIVKEFAARLLEQPPTVTEDPAVVSIEEGRRKALESVRDVQA
jgi:hypothetical protein